MRLAVLCLLLSSCGPVRLGEDERLHDAGSLAEPSGAVDASASAGMDSDGALPPTPGAIPQVTLHVQPIECGRCFELRAEGTGGQAPYAFEWNDGAKGANRILCVDNGDVAVSVVARDAKSMRSAPEALNLQRALDLDCSKPEMPATPPPRPRLCLQNGSFEGTPAANFGQQQAFDATPWSACTNPIADNTPDIGNADVAQTLGPIPNPTKGLTYLALGEGEQVSQEFCSPAPSDGTLAVEFDLTRLNIGAGLVPETEQVFLEVWGGLSVDCSTHELLWKSPALEVGWKRYCAPLQPHNYMTQLTLRASADMTLPTPAYLAIDDMQAVDACP